MLHGFGQEINKSPFHRHGQRLQMQAKMVAGIYEG
jgi:hypothetical protein